MSDEHSHRAEEVERRLPIVHEDLVLSSEARETGRVSIQKRVDTEDVTVEDVRTSDTVRIDRIPKNVKVDEILNAREEDGVLIVPV